MEAAGRADFGTLLRQLRLAATLTQQELAERANLSVEAIGQLERGARTRPQRETVVLLARALDLSPERQALLTRAISSTHPPRRREHGQSNLPLLRLVRSDVQTTAGHNLPQQLTSFVGRQQEIGEIAELLREHRIVAIVGAGGVGKTRVAAELAVALLDDYPDGVWFVDLAPLSQQALAEDAVLTVLQLPSSTASAIDVVIAHLKTRRALLILDNCEHVVAQVREVAGKIFEACPMVRVLATSREALAVAGEQVYRLPSLAIPPKSCLSAQDALSYGAVSLFVDRARAVDPAFVLTDDTARDVVDICRRLDGIPLAIELAAARVRVLAPRQIAQRLDQRFRLLTRGEPGALPRHQTMTALLDWSYELLTAREQRFFESLSVFPGGCTLEAATYVCAIDGEDDVDVIELITSLVTKSLLVAELAGSEERYRLLESSRQYARDKLSARGEMERTVRRHALAYVELAERLEAARDTTLERAWLSQAIMEVENYRTVLEWTLAERGDVVLGQRLVAAHGVLLRAFTLPEGRRWVREAVEIIDEQTPPDLSAQLELAEAVSLQQLGGWKLCLTAAERALARFRNLGDLLGTAQAQMLAGGALACLGSPAEAEHLLQSALETARGIGRRLLIVRVLQRIGWARSALGDFDGARTYLTEALELAKGFDTHAPGIALSLASTHSDAGDPATALRLTVETLAKYEGPNSLSMQPQVRACALVNAADCLVELGRFDEAQARANEALQFAHEHQLHAVVALSLEHLAVAATLMAVDQDGLSPAKAAHAARLLGFVGAARNTLGIEEAVGQKYDQMLSMIRTAIGADEFSRRLAAGATMIEDEAIAAARALE